MRLQIGYLRRDLQRYSWFERFTEPSVVPIAVYRIGRGALTLPLPLRAVATVVYVWSRLLARIISAGIDIPRVVVIGPGLRIYHGGPVVLGHNVSVGSNCVLGHGVTIAALDESGSGPTIGDNVVLSSYAQVLGEIRVGDGAKVGAMSVVLSDLPAGVTAAGVPARVVGGAKGERPANT